MCHYTEFMLNQLTVTVTVEVRPEFPIKGFHFILGNDLAGVKF